MSYRPNAFGWKEPTGPVYTYPSLQGWTFHPGYCWAAAWSATFASAQAPSRLSFQGRGSAKPARAAYSHSDSVGSRYFWPVFFDNQAANSRASRHDTQATGCSDVCVNPTLFQLSSELSCHLPLYIWQPALLCAVAAENSRNSPSVISYTPMPSGGIRT